MGTPSRTSTWRSAPAAPSVEHATLPQFLTPGPDGNVWFTEVSGEQHSIGRVTPAGDITEFKVAETNASTNGIAAGADGDIWFTEAGFGGSDVWRVHPDGSFVGTAIPVHPTPVGLAVGPDGNLWFASRLDGEIGRIGAAPAARGFVLEIASGFAPALRTVSLGRLVQWVMEAPGTHRVRDATGMGLYDSGPVDPVSFATFRFPAAGRYPYADGPGHRRGAVAVGMDGPATADLGSPAHLRWATAGAPDGMVFDVQVQRPGSDRFTAFRTATPSHGTTFTPALAGSWRFRARMHPSGQPGTGTRRCVWSTWAEPLAPRNRVRAAAFAVALAASAAGSVPNVGCPPQPLRQRAGPVAGLIRAGHGPLHVPSSHRGLVPQLRKPPGVRPPHHSRPQHRDPHVSSSAPMFAAPIMPGSRGR